MVMIRVPIILTILNLHMCKKRRMVRKKIENIASNNLPIKYLAEKFEGVQNEY